MRIRVIVTGGTFDKEYNELDGTLFFKNTHLPEMFTLGRSRVDVIITPLMMIDSLEMTEPTGRSFSTTASDPRRITSSLPTEPIPWRRPLDFWERLR